MTAARDLASAEMTLARDDLTRAATQSVAAVLLLGTAVVTAASGMQLMLLSAAFARQREPSRPMLLGFGLLSLAVIAGTVGTVMLPSNPLGGIRERLAENARRIRRDHR
ncbi:hypothetical protein [Chondromyces crocatus]|nr:hypothetical protein [Chondromyces crocatus]